MKTFKALLIPLLLCLISVQSEAEPCSSIFQSEQSSTSKNGLYGQMRDTGKVVVKSFRAAWDEALQSASYFRKGESNHVTPVLYQTLVPMMAVFKEAIQELPVSKIRELALLELRKRQVHIEQNTNANPMKKTLSMFGETTSKPARLMHHALSEWNDNFRDLSQVKRTEESIWLSPDHTIEPGLGAAPVMLSTVVTPVGAYGVEFAKATQLTTAILMRIARESLQEVSADIQANNDLMLRHEIARAMHAKTEGTSAEMAPLAAMIEGILSLHQLIGSVLAEKIPGIENGEQALHLLLTGSGSRLGLPSLITNRLSMGTVGPIGQGSGYFVRPLNLDEHGHLVMTTEFEDFLTRRRGHRKKTCPFAGLFGEKKASEGGEPLTTPIQDLSVVYLRIFDQVLAMQKTSEP